MAQKLCKPPFQHFYLQSPSSFVSYSSYYILGVVYRNRIAADHAQNVEQAIICEQNALQVPTHTAFSELWPETQNNLGNAHNQRILSEEFF